ncbi:Rim9p [Sporobolomyces salmoneus]|uniref:Rim9p n=1 Tax=Sporobolomyces salmoneus TaxID=183962 RepID=UPI00317160E4
MGIRPATPGTIVVLAATVLLILVSVSTPLLKSIYFLEANLSSGNYLGTVRLGAWGYCVGGTCTSPKLGYSLNVAELLDIDGRISGISNSVLKWITYLMVLHPIAAAFGVVSVIFGLLAHMRGFAGTALTTCFASFAATFSLLAFVFDIAVFVIAKQRIESSSVGGSASLGPAVWMTLAAMILFGLSGCFFGCGACVIRKQRAGREASEKNRPLPDVEYGSKLRGDALAAHERDKSYAAQQSRHEGVLPAFTEHERDKEDIPLNSMQAVAFDDDGYQPRTYPSEPYHQGAPSIVTGVGQGYGRRNDAPHGGMPVSFAPEPVTSAYPSLPPPAPTGTPNNAGRGTGTGSRLAADARAQRGYEPTTEAFQGMHDTRQSSTSPGPLSNLGHYQSSSSYDHQNMSYPSMPVPQTQFNGPREPQSVSPTYQGGYPAYPPPTTSTPAALTPGGGAVAGIGSSNFRNEKPQRFFSSSSPPPHLQPPQQQSFYVQNPSPSTHQPDASSYAPSEAHGHGLNPQSTGGGGGIDRVPSTHAPTYYSYEDPYQQQQQGGGGGSINYHGGGGQSTDQYGYQNRY